MSEDYIYPELKEMKQSEVFVEWIYIVKGKKGSGKADNVAKSFCGKVMSKKELPEFISELKQLHNISNDPELYETINLTTISK